MGELKKKRQRLEDRKERRAIEKEGRDDDDLGDDVPVLIAQAPSTSEFDDKLTRDMFGDCVLVTTTLDSLGPKEDEEEEEVVTARKGNSVDQAQKYAYSFKAVKEKIDAKQLTTKRQRKAQRNKSHATLESKGKRVAGGKEKPADAKALLGKAIKTANFGKKKPKAAKKAAK